MTTLGFIVSPAKKMNVVEGPPYPTTQPEHLERTRLLFDALRSLSYDQAKELWQCSDRLARANYQRLHESDLGRNLTAAALAYEGIQYQHLAAQVLDEDSLSYLERHLRILSGFYGVLRPTDGVVPYRLEMQARLALPARGEAPATKDLYAFWGDEAFALMTSDTTVLMAAEKYKIWLIGMPLISTLAFMWDGVYIGATAGVQIRDSMIWAAVGFIVGYVATFSFVGPQALYIGYFAHLIARAFYLTIQWNKIE